jgi:hypothetical protein
MAVLGFPPSPSPVTEAQLAAAGDTRYLRQISERGSFRNKIINGNFDIWQRGTSIASSGYLADRWRIYNTGASLNLQSRQGFTPGQADVPGGPRYFHRLDWAGTANTSSVYLLTDQYVEDVEALAGKTVTLSFWAKASTARTLGLSSTQIFGTGGSDAVQTHIGTVNLTPAWQKFTLTFDSPSVAGKTLGPPETSSTSIRFWWSASSDYVASSGSGVTTAAGIFDIAQVQLEEGPVATPFEQRPIGLELSLCQRYYEIVESSTRAYTSNGYIGSHISYKATKRVTPTITILSIANSPLATARFDGTVANGLEGCGCQFNNLGVAGDTYYYRASFSADAEL